MQRERESLVLKLGQLETLNKDLTSFKRRIEKGMSEEEKDDVV